MKVLGLLGGIFWVSTIDYYRYINEEVNRRLGSNEAAECMIYSLNYGEVMRNIEAGHLDKTFEKILDGCRKLQQSGAEAILVCANTMHMFAERLQAELSVPLIHIAVAAAEAIQAQNLTKVGLLGTKPTMEMDFYKDKLHEYGLVPVVPAQADRNYIHEKIITELGHDQMLPETKTRFLAIIQKLIDDGAEGIVLGCTEIPLLIKQSDVSVPVFDTTFIHAQAAVKFALQ